MSDLSGLWPKVRVGYRVKLKDGREGDVVAYLSARDVLKFKTEMEALLMGPRLQAIYGSQWIDLYYEATIQLDGDFEQVVVTPNDIDRIIGR